MIHTCTIKLIAEAMEQDGQYDVLRHEAETTELAAPELAEEASSSASSSAAPAPSLAPAVPPDLVAVMLSYGFHNQSTAGGYKLAKGDTPYGTIYYMGPGAKQSLQASCSVHKKGCKLWVQPVRGRDYEIIARMMQWLHESHVDSAQHAIDAYHAKVGLGMTRSKKPPGLVG